MKKSETNSKKIKKSEKQQEKDFAKYLKSLEYKPLPHTRQSLADEDCLSFL